MITPRRAWLQIGSAEEIALESQYPSVEVAFPMVLASYDALQKRLDAVDTRIQALQNLAVTLLVSVLAFTRAADGHIDIGSRPLIGAVVAAVAVVVTAQMVRVWGSLKMMDPNVLYQRWLHQSPWEFKKNAIYIAGAHFTANRSLVQRRATVFWVMTVGLFAEMSLLGVWLFAPSSS